MTGWRERGREREREREREKRRGRGRLRVRGKGENECATVLGRQHPCCSEQSVIKHFLRVKHFAKGSGYMPKKNQRL